MYIFLFQCEKFLIRNIDDIFLSIVEEFCQTCKLRLKICSIWNFGVSKVVNSGQLYCWFTKRSSIFHMTACIYKRSLTHVWLYLTCCSFDLSAFLHSNNVLWYHFRGQRAWHKSLLANLNPFPHRWSDSLLFF